MQPSWRRQTLKSSQTCFRGWVFCWRHPMLLTECLLCIIQFESNHPWDNKRPTVCSFNSPNLSTDGTNPKQLTIPIPQPTNTFSPLLSSSPLPHEPPSVLKPLLLPLASANNKYSSVALAWEDLRYTEITCIEHTWSLGYTGTKIKVTCLCAIKYLFGAQSATAIQRLLLLKCFLW